MAAERDLSSTFLSLLEAEKVLPIIFLYADFPTQPYALWTGVGDYDDGTITWRGMGGVVSIGGIPETRDGSGMGISVELDGIDPDIVDEISGQNFQGRLAYINIGLMNPATGLPEIPVGYLWEGELDSSMMQFARDSIKLSVRCEHAQVDTLRRREYHYNMADQTLLFPAVTDTGFSRVGQIQDLTVPWGRKQK